MRTLRCTMGFKDGAKLTAHASARSSLSEVSVNWSGPVERLPMRLDKGTLDFIDFCLRGLAANAGAEIEIMLEGEFEE